MPACNNHGITFFRYVVVDPEQALDHYNRVVEKMRGEKLYSYDAGKTVIADLESITDDDKIKLSSTVIKMKNQSDTDIVQGLESITLDHSLTSRTQNHVVQYLLSEQLPGSTVSATTKTTAVLTQSEREASDYVGGALIRALFKIRGQGADVLEVICSWTDEVDASSWTGLQDRGKLIYVTERFSTFLVSLDSASSTVLSASVGQNCNIRQIVMDAILNCIDVAMYWESIDGGLEREESNELLYRLVRKYSSVRCKAFMLSRKRKLDYSKGKQANPSASFRQTLP